MVILMCNLCDVNSVTSDEFLKSLGINREQLIKQPMKFKGQYIRLMGIAKQILVFSSSLKIKTSSVFNGDTTVRAFNMLRSDQRLTAITYIEGLDNEV